MRLRDRTAIVTECGVGDTFGVAWARGLAREGAAVVVADRDLDRAQAVAAGLVTTGARATAAQLDVASRESCDAVVEVALRHFGSVDVLANTHHVWHDLRADDDSDAYLHEVLDFNALSILRTAQAVFPAMRARGRGRIISLSSIGAWQVTARTTEQVQQTGRIPSFAYPASKVLENGLTRFLAATLGQFGITVNAIAPGMIRSPGTMARLSAEERDAFVARTALRRILDVEDTVGTLLHLASDDGAVTTGQVLVVDAGLIMLG